MKQPGADHLRAGYAPVARAYADALSAELDGKPLDRALLVAIAESAPAGRIADVGCGPGQVAAFLAARREPADVIGYDLSPEMIREARDRHPAISFEVGDLYDLPCPPRSLAAVVAFYAIVHLDPVELTDAIAALADRLMTAAPLVLAFHVGHERVHVDELFGCPTDLHFVMHRPDDVLAAIARAGLRVDARLERRPYANAEHPTERCYLVASRP